MSTINVTNLSGRGGATPNLPDGANITGVATATSFDGSLKSTGTPTLGLGVTINASGISVSGVLTATTFKGDGSGLTGVGESIAPWNYNPDVNDINTSTEPGIGITFNKKVSAGSGTATIKIVNAGAAGTTIQSWGVSSCTFNVTKFTLGSLVSNLTINQTYQLDIPSGFIVDSAGSDYVGTAYTFAIQDGVYKLWDWGNAHDGALGLNNTGDIDVSSPTQVPGEGWNPPAMFNSNPYLSRTRSFVKTDGTLWVWGANDDGSLGQNNTGTHMSSPAQLGSGTDWKGSSWGKKVTLAIKTDGTMWAWGDESQGSLGVNSRVTYSSPIQIPGTTWSVAAVGSDTSSAIRTDGTLWTWGTNSQGQLGLNDRNKRSSPVQVPGTTWKSLDFEEYGSTFAVKTDGTLWAWGYNVTFGQLGLNNKITYSSPVQIPGTSWANVNTASYGVYATRTDGTLWSWGQNNHGHLGHNNTIKYSSPTQIPGTTWPTAIGKLCSASYSAGAVKTDGTLWMWGYNDNGQLGQNGPDIKYSSPVQVGSNTDWHSLMSGQNTYYGIQYDATP